MVENLEGVLAELRDLQQPLLELPEDAYGERLNRKERRRALRNQAAELRKAGRSMEELEKELEGLRNLRDEVFERHLSLGNIGPGGGEGGWRNRSALRDRGEPNDRRSRGSCQHQPPDS